MYFFDRFDDHRLALVYERITQLHLHRRPRRKTDGRKEERRNDALALADRSWTCPQCKTYFGRQPPAKPEAHKSLVCG